MQEVFSEQSIMHRAASAKRVRWKMKTFNREIGICALSDTDLSCAENSAEMR